MADHPNRASVIAFCGVEGSGKSTQAGVAVELLKERGVRAKHVPFISLGVATRASRAWRRLRGTGAKPRDFAAIAPSPTTSGKGTRAPRWRLSHLRRALTHTLDVLLLPRFLARERRRGVEVVVFDRYFHDALVRWNLPPALLRALEAITPSADLTFLLEAQPDVIEARRGPGSGAAAHRRQAAFEATAARYEAWVRVRSEEPEAAREAIARALDAWQG